MSNVPSLLIRLEAWAREEHAAQEELDLLLDRQERAALAFDTDELVAAGEAIRARLGRGADREARRRQVLDGLAVAWGVAPGTLTLGSIAERAERAGLDARRLRTAREELRRVAAGVLRRGRRLASLARYHRGFFAEVLGILAPAGSRDEGPALVDAEA